MQRKRSAPRAVSILNLTPQPPETVTTRVGGAERSIKDAREAGFGGLTGRGSCCGVVFQVVRRRQPSDVEVVFHEVEKHLFSQLARGDPHHTRSCASRPACLSWRVAARRPALRCPRRASCVASPTRLATECLRTVAALHMGCLPGCSGDRASGPCEGTKVLSRAKAEVGGDPGKAGKPWAYSRRRPADRGGWVRAPGPRLSLAPRRRA